MLRCSGLARSVLIVAVLAWIAVSSSAAAARADSAVTPAAVICAKDAPFAEALAAKEIRRYLYLRTGKLPPLAEELNASGAGGLIVVGRKDQPIVQSLLTDAKLRAAVEGLAPQQYVLRTIEHGGRPIVLVAGGDSFGALYGAYRLAEHFGVRFYLHGDVLPDTQAAPKVPHLDEVGRPLFDCRGIQPFHDFPEGPDWWNTDAYQAVLGQLPKLRMNFFGLHTYPQGRVGPEPTVWIGTADDAGPDGKVNSSYPSRHFTTRNVTGAWGYQPTKTSDYAFGAAELYDRDDYAADTMAGTYPWNEMSPEDCNALFCRTGDLLRDAFTCAGRLGIKTCLGTETPLVVPTAVQQRLKAAGKDLADPAVVQQLYEGIFQRISKTHPLDYYWFWTPENWTWQGTKQQQIDATLADFRAAIAAAEKVKPPFTLATCGWVLGPAQDRALFDNALPKTMPMSCINRQTGHAPVEPGFAKVQGRPKWAIPWLEDDGAMILPQLWAGRMRKDAADALSYGCTGLLGIHWRTRILGPNVAALAKAAWDQDGPAYKDYAADRPAGGPGGRGRDLPADDFYADWALAEFGPEVAELAAELFARIDGRLPRPSTWVNGPGGIKPDPQPWAEVRKQYAFVDELAALRPRVQGAGNLERFDYWLDNFRYLRSVGQVNCTWARFNEAMAKVKAEKDAGARKRLVREVALPLRRQLVAQVAQVHRHLLATVSTPGELGTVTNWQQHVLPTLLTTPGQELAKILGEDLPADALPAKTYSGRPRLIVPVVRTSLLAGEPLKLTVILAWATAAEAAVYRRPLGSGEFARLPLVHARRGVYSLTLPPEATKADFEYYVEAQCDGGPSLRWPATAPALNQTVVVVEAK